MEKASSFVNYLDDILIIGVGSVACVAISDFIPREDGIPLTRLYVNGEDSFFNAHDGLFQACPGGVSDENAAHDALNRLHPDLVKAGVRIVLVVDLASSMGRQTAMMISSALQDKGQTFIIIGIGPNKEKSSSCGNDAIHCTQSLQKLCNGFLLMDSMRFDSLEAMKAYLHHACNIIMEVSSIYSQVGADFEDVCDALVGKNSKMGYAVIQQSSPSLKFDVIDQITKSCLLTGDELRHSTNVFLVVEAVRGVLHLRTNREIMYALYAQVNPEINIHFASVYGNYTDQSIGVTVLASY